MMGSEIKFWNPYTSRMEVEKIYGEKWLRFSYQSTLGKIGLWGMVKRKWFSSWYGSRMDASASRNKIFPFVEKYNLDQSEFLDPPETFKTFNEFFYRKLKPNARPIDTGKKSIIFPADGRHLLIPNLSEVKHIYAKGQKFCLESLLGCPVLANQWQNGAMLISRLCPVDYHRFHFPTSGHLSTTTLIDGSLFSVNPIALRQKISIFWQNKRYLSVLDNKYVGKIAQLLVGATCVGSVHQTSNDDCLVHKGGEYGYFSFGGSCVITIYPKNRVTFRKELVEKSVEGVESYFKFGDKLGQILE